MKSGSRHFSSRQAESGKMRSSGILLWRGNLAETCLIWVVYIMGVVYILGVVFPESFHFTPHFVRNVSTFKSPEFRDPSVSRKVCGNLQFCNGKFVIRDRVRCMTNRLRYDLERIVTAKTVTFPQTFRGTEGSRNYGLLDPETLRTKWGVKWTLSGNTPPKMYRPPIMYIFQIRQVVTWQPLRFRQPSA